MRIRQLTTTTLLAVVMSVLLAAPAMAADLADGDYTLTLPGIGDFEFTIDSGGSKTVVAVAAPEGYQVDDDDPDKAAWKNAASLEVEAKIDLLEGDYDWTNGSAVVTLPGGGTITITEPDANGHFTVSGSGGWYAFGGAADWYVADNANIALATSFFKVEATAKGVEVKAVDVADTGFLNELKEEEEEEEAEEEEVETEDDGD